MQHHDGATAARFFMFFLVPFSLLVIGLCDELPLSSALGVNAAAVALIPILLIMMMIMTMTLHYKLNFRSAPLKIKYSILYLGSENQF